MEASSGGRIFQINLSDGGVPKLAQRQAEVTLRGLAGDRQRNTRVHGGPDRALCLFSLERILDLQGEGHPVFPGAMGENLTLSGIDWERVEPGICLRLGDQVAVEVTKYTLPCNNLVPYFMDGEYGRVSPSLHPGWSRVYARVLQPGWIKTGDRVVIE